MLITYYEDGATSPKRASRIMALLMGANGLVAGVILFAWTYVALFVAEPLSWAVWRPVQRGYGLTGVLEYPFIMFWLLPLVGIFGAWVSLKSGNKTIAYAFVAVPLAMLMLVMGWFYLAPTDWH